MSGAIERAAAARAEAAAGRIADALAAHGIEVRVAGATVTARAAGLHARRLAEPALRWPGAAA